MEATNGNYAHDLLMGLLANRNGCGCGNNGCGCGNGDGYDMHTVNTVTNNNNRNTDALAASIERGNIRNEELGDPPLFGDDLKERRFCMDDRFGGLTFTSSTPPAQVADFEDAFGSSENTMNSMAKAINAKLEALKPQGKKDDAGKPRWDLLPYDALDVVVQILTDGVVEHGERNWEKGFAAGRLEAALMRHFSAHMQNYLLDVKSRKYHTAHIACNALMLLALQLRKDKARGDA